jgi:hypothetical protein
VHSAIDAFGPALCGGPVLWWPCFCCKYWLLVKLLHDRPVLVQESQELQLFATTVWAAWLVCAMLVLLIVAAFLKLESADALAHIPPFALLAISSAAALWCVQCMPIIQLVKGMLPFFLS